MTRFALAAALSTLLVSVASGQTAPSTSTAPGATPHALGTGVSPPHAAAQTFRSEGEAQTMCTGDTVVWASKASHNYYTSDLPGFAKRKPGYFMCQRGAEAGGYHLLKAGG